MLNQPAFRNAKILLADENFGCGSSREAAIWALQQFGITCVLAPSFADIFYENAFRNGVLAARIDPATFEALRNATTQANHANFTIDLAAGTLTAPGGATYPIQVPAARAQALLKGQDEIAAALALAPEIDAYYAAARHRPALALPGAKLISRARLIYPAASTRPQPTKTRNSGGDRMKNFRNALKTLAIAALATATIGQARADDIVVSNYGVSANGMPFAVAMEKGFFKEEGANVTGILSSPGGGTTLRNMLAGSAPFAEVNPNAVIAAIQQGANIKIVSDDVLTVAEFVWAVKPDSPIHSVADLKGHKLGYTQPRSTSLGLATLVLQSGGLKTEDATLVKTGGFGEGVAALDINLVDATPIPNRSGRNSTTNTARSPSPPRSCRRSPTWSAWPPATLPRHRPNSSKPSFARAAAPSTT